MKTKKFILFLFTLFFSLAYGKEENWILDFNEYFNSELTEDNIEITTAEIEEINENLAFLYENPININSATREQLEKIPFLKHSQIENLLEYIFDYGPLESIYELILIEGFDLYTIKNCLPLLTLYKVEKREKFSIKKAFKYGKSHLTLYSSGTLQKKEGYKNGKYLGKPYSLYLKYYFKHKNMSFGFLGSKSEGEPFDFKYNKGFDFYSCHLYFSDISKYIKTIAIGDYKMVFGQGLVFKSSSNFSNASIENAIISSDNIRPSYSTSETGYYRGAAIQIGGKKLSFSLLSSFTYYNKSEGYHRTLNDFEKRYKSPSYMVGSNINYTYKYFKIGFSGYYDFYDKWFNAGIDYRFRIGRFLFAGETAFDKNFKFATINSVTFSCNDFISVCSLFRYYPLGYRTKYGNAYSKNSHTDETGLYVGIDVTPFKKIKLEAYMDVYRISFIKTNINKPSVGFKFNIKTIYKPDDNNTCYLRYNVYSKEKNISNNDLVKKTGITYRHNITLNYNISLKENFSFNANIISSVFKVDSLNNSNRLSYGFMVSSYGSWFAKKGRFSITAGAAFFDIPFYDNVIYFYEPSLHYTFSSPQYYGIGARFFFLLKIAPVKGMTIDFKVSNIYYVDREDIGSGNEKINGRNKTQISGILSYTF